MTSLPGKAISLWRDGDDVLDCPPLSQDLDVDVCVLGAGITGMTAALELARAGKRVAVLEMHRVGEGVTGNTTAKITALHQVIYSELESKFGQEGAASYAAANQEAIARVGAIVGELGIQCGFRHRPNFTYTESEKQVSTLRDEAEAAQRAELPARFVTETPLPWDVLGAVVVDDQAEFDPHPYLLAIAREVQRLGGQIYESTTATHVGEGARPTVKTRGGAKVSAGDVIVATHYPFVDRGLFFARMTPYRSYAIAVRPPSGEVPHGMFINNESPSRSIRAHATPEGELLVIGGEGHLAGEKGDRNDECYRNLATFARERFGATEVTHRWSAHDPKTADGVPYVGRATPFSKHVWIATGYRKWGITNGTAAAGILADRILDRENRHADFFDSQRFTPLRSAQGVGKEVLKDAAHFIGDRFKRPEGESLDALAPGEGKLLNLDGELVAAHRTEAGEVHCVSPVCTHLGCRVGWNKAESTWDCPCHGSRFAPDGEVLEGPAVQPLKQKTPNQPV